MAREPHLEARALLDNVIQAGIDGEYRDYLGAEQAVMAIDVLLIDANLPESIRRGATELYRLCRAMRRTGPQHSSLP